QVVSSHSVKGGRKVETSNRCCLGYFLQAGFLFPKPSSQNLEFRAQKNRLTPGVRIFPPVGGFKLLVEG
ncbi:MAG: hypothetical protein P8163_11310, partial [Candidatus Thiodiazotropha sp.]